MTRAPATNDTNPNIKKRGSFIFIYFYFLHPIYDIDPW